MLKKKMPETVDNENPQWTEKRLHEAKSFENSNLPESFKTVIRRGRPPIDSPKKAINIRLSSDIVKYFRSTGKGWQTRIDQALREYIILRR